ncbi:hypothetical protein JCM30394_36090 [Deferrisoma palaeochoriense]
MPYYCASLVNVEAVCSDREYHKRLRKAAQKGLDEDYNGCLDDIEDIEHRYGETDASLYLKYVCMSMSPYEVHRQDGVNRTRQKLIDLRLGAAVYLDADLDHLVDWILRGFVPGNSIYALDLQRKDRLKDQKEAFEMFRRTAERLLNDLKKKGLDKFAGIAVADSIKSYQFPPDKELLFPKNRDEFETEEDYRIRVFKEGNRSPYILSTVELPTSVTRYDIDKGILWLPILYGQTIRTFSTAGLDLIDSGWFFPPEYPRWGQEDDLVRWVEWVFVANASRIGAFTHVYAWSLLFLLKAGQSCEADRAQPGIIHINESPIDGIRFGIPMEVEQAKALKENGGSLNVELTFKACQAGFEGCIVSGGRAISDGAVLVSKKGRRVILKSIAVKDADNKQFGLWMCN